MAKRDKNMTTDPIEEVSAPEAPAPAPVEEKISFDQWWMTMSKRLKLKAHIKEILIADLQGRGLSVKGETKKSYDDAAKAFGYKW